MARKLLGESRSLDATATRRRWRCTTGRAVFTSQVDAGDVRAVARNSGHCTSRPTSGTKDPNADATLRLPSAVPPTWYWAVSPSAVPPGTRTSPTWAAPSGTVPSVSVAVPSVFGRCGPPSGYWADARPWVGVGNSGADSGRAAGEASSDCQAGDDRCEFHRLSTPSSYRAADHLSPKTRSQKANPAVRLRAARSVAQRVDRLRACLII